MRFIRRHWMAVPIAAITPFLITAAVLNKTGQWSDQTYGGVATLLLVLAAVVGSFLVEEI